MKKIIVALIIVCSLILSGCGREAEKPTLSSEGVETTITENIITEVILYEDVSTTWD